MVSNNVRSAVVTHLVRNIGIRNTGVCRFVGWVDKFSCTFTAPEDEAMFRAPSIAGLSINMHVEWPLNIILRLNRVAYVIISLIKLEFLWA